MIHLNKLIVLGIFTVFFGSCKGQEPKAQVEKATQSYIEQDPLAHHQVALEVIAASKRWVQYFNQGNGQKCGDDYAENAVMHPNPMGIKRGKKEISEFWINFIKTGATDLVYTNVSVEVVNEKLALLSANWSMNVGRGVIYREKWEKINGVWVYTYDDFEVLEKFDEPRDTQENATASHEALEAVIKASMHWTKGFNSKNTQICGDGYTQSAVLSPSPFPEVSGQENIQAFWTKLVNDGAGNLIYNNPTFTSVAENRVILSSNWSMNIGEGKIFQEKWIFENGKWMLDYDDFMILKQY